MRKDTLSQIARTIGRGEREAHLNCSPERALSAAMRGGLRAAWWRSERGVWGKKIARQRGSYSRGIDRKRSRINAHLHRAITGHHCCSDVVAGAVWGRRGRRGLDPLVSETRKILVGSGCQRLFACARACEKERRSPGGLAGLDPLLGQILAARPFSIVYFFSFSISIFWNGF